MFETVIEMPIFPELKICLSFIFNANCQETIKCPFQKNCCKKTLDGFPRGRESEWQPNLWCHCEVLTWIWNVQFYFTQSLPHMMNKLSEPRVTHKYLSCISVMYDFLSKMLQNVAIFNKSLFLYILLPIKWIVFWRHQNWFI